MSAETWANARSLRSILIALLAKAREINERLKITGILVNHANAFLQVLECPEAAVDDLYQQINQDLRHTPCPVLLCWDIVRRNFGDWMMAFVKTKL